jgi:hypothetical protein
LSPIFHKSVLQIPLKGYFFGGKDCAKKKEEGGVHGQKLNLCVLPLCTHGNKSIKSGSKQVKSGSYAVMTKIRPLSESNDATTWIGRGILRIWQEHARERFVILI